MRWHQLLGLWIDLQAIFVIVTVDAMHDIRADQVCILENPFLSAVYHIIRKVALDGCRKLGDISQHACGAGRRSG